MTASFLTNPLDVIKTKLQIQNQCSCLEEGKSVDYCTKAEGINGEKGEKAIELKYRDIRHAISMIIKHDGYPGFFKGVLPRMMYVSPGVAISWGTYEFFKTILIKEQHLTKN